MIAIEEEQLEAKARSAALVRRSKRSPDERSDIRGQFLNVSHPHVAALMRATCCLSWTALGKSYWEIGRILCISENTVIFHIKNAMRKLGTSSRTLATMRALQLGLIEFDLGVEH